MNNEEVKMGQLARKWPTDGKIAKNITFCVTENCNLACKYCYMTGKNDKNRMTYETAKKIVDYILNDNENFSEDAVVWDFIGGEPFLEIELIDQISDYIKQQMYIMEHRWFNAYRFSFSTNGILYNAPRVQEYIKKNRNHLSIGISIDGNKTKHDMQRVYKDGSGSYDDVVKNIPLWIQQFGEVMTKATFSRDDLPYLKDSIISLWNIGIKIVAANIVFENTWQQGDDILFENQLRSLADYVIENKLWDKVSVRFFDPNVGLPLPEEAKMQNYCGAGKMIAVSCDGKFYPCIRFTDFSLSKKKGLCIGDIEKGINRDLLRPFYGLNYYNQSPQKCIDCEIAGGCAWCTGSNYDESQDDSIYKRTTYNCDMHRANARANEYFWKRYSEATGKQSPREKRLIEIKHDNNPKYLFFITDDNITPHCSYRNNGTGSNIMEEQIIEKGLLYAKKNEYKPVFLGDQNGDIRRRYPEQIYFIDSKTISDLDKSDNSKNIIHIYDNTIKNASLEENICNLVVSSENLNKLRSYIEELFPYKQRINVVLDDIYKWNANDLATYEKQLSDISEIIIEAYKNSDKKEINILTDRIYLKDFCSCDSGKGSIALAPNGNFYLCPGFYYQDPENYIGNIQNGVLLKDYNLQGTIATPICSGCDAYQCMRCKSLNKKLTREIGIPSKIQCIISHIERNVSKDLQKKLVDLGLIANENTIPDIDYSDPLEIKLRQERRTV